MIFFSVQKRVLSKTFTTAFIWIWCMARNLFSPGQDNEVISNLVAVAVVVVIAVAVAEVVVVAVLAVTVMV